MDIGYFTIFPHFLVRFLHALYIYVSQYEAEPVGAGIFLGGPEPKFEGGTQRTMVDLFRLRTFSPTVLRSIEFIKKYI